MSNLKAYRAGVFELVLTRSEHGGELPEELEPEMLGKLDRLWLNLTEDERRQAEASLSGQFANAPVVLNVKEHIPR